jgi:cytochrome b561
MNTIPTAERPLPSGERWKPVQVALHWLTVSLLLLTVVIILYLVLYPPLPQTARGTWLWDLQFYLFNIHFILGVLILVTMGLRLIARLIYGSPPLPKTVPTWQGRAARAVHWLLYLNITFMVVIGLITIDVGGYYIEWRFWAWPIFPKEHEPDLELTMLMFDVHFWGAMSLLGLVTIHIGAALKHHFIDKDAVLYGMLPARFRK